MSDMIERVARAIHSCEAWSSFWSMDDARVLARAAIEAMREPTEGMLAAPLHEADGCDAQYQTDADFAAAWAAMIEAALKQP